MVGRGTAPRRGEDLKRRVVELGKKLGLEVDTEVKAARRLWGARRHIDVVYTHPETKKKLGIECKTQAEGGTAEEKILATIKDIESWPIPGIVVIEGEGFSKNMQGYLMSTGKVVWFDDLEEWCRLYFSL
ncbi:MAG: hypothetical protein N2559_03155 [Anaerolineae bacterium]|nr:hypothetical protein [Anaerolineae bacterium]